MPSYGRLGEMLLKGRVSEDTDWSSAYKTAFSECIAYGRLVVLVSILLMVSR